MCEKFVVWAVPGWNAAYYDLAAGGVTSINVLPNFDDFEVAITEIVGFIFQKNTGTFFF